MSVVSVVVIIIVVVVAVALAQPLPKKLVLVIDVDCPVLVVRCFSHHALYKIMSSTPHDPETIGVLAHTQREQGKLTEVTVRSRAKEVRKKNSI